MLVTKNLVPGESVYGEKRISIDGGVDATKIEYRVWNPFRSKLAAGILGGVENIYIVPGAKVLYLGAASGTSVSHVADVVGPVRSFSYMICRGKVLIQPYRRAQYMQWSFPIAPVVTLLVWRKRGLMLSVRSPYFFKSLLLTNQIYGVAIIEDARHPQKYRMLLSMVDVIFADVAQPDQARIVAINAHQFLKEGGHVVISIKANCIDSTAPAAVVFESERNKLASEKIKPIEQLTLEVKSACFFFKAVF